MSAGRWIKIADIPRSGLPADQQLKLVATALEELAVAQALVMVHGPERGLARYAAIGGRVLPGADGAPVIWSPA
jgi:hypothetical protein